MKRGARDQQSVLVVDDDELVRWSAAERLRECGYRVEVAASVGEALERCPSAEVALLNHDPPGVDGLALADIVRRHCPGCAVVLMAADPTVELRLGARERDISRVLGKPYSLEDLVDAIGDAIGPPSAPGEGPSGRPRETEAPGGV
jgi:DNA-binding NtrC family response regulator